MRHEMNRIQSKVHNIGTYGIKISLSSYSDQKIYILEDGYSRFSYFCKCTPTR